MSRLSHWLGLVVAASGVVAACGSDDAKPSPQVTAGSGGEAEGGAATNGQGGGAELAGGSALGGASDGGADAGGMTDGWLSGSRLRALLDVSGDAKMFKTWHDTELDIDCAFALDADGVERCMPTLDAGYAVYSDAECKVAVGLVRADQELPPFVMEPFKPTECGKGVGYFELGATVSGVSDVYSASSGACEPNGTVGQNQIAKKLGAAVPAATFLAASKRLREPRDARLSANVRIAKDGSRQVTSHFDLEREVDCGPIERTGFACVPEDRAYIEVEFEDAECSVQAAYHPGYGGRECGLTPSIVLDSSPMNTGDYFELGDLIETPIYRGFGASCELYETARNGNAGYYLIGKSAPWSQFPQLSDKSEGTARIAILTLRGGEDELIAREAFFDTELGSKCGPNEASDHEVYCMPYPTFPVNLFSDASCSKALYENPVGEPLPPDLNLLSGNALGGGTAVFKIGTKTSAPAKAYQMGGTDCEERGVTPNVDFYATTPIPPAALAPMTTELE